VSSFCTHGMLAKVVGQRNGVAVVVLE
jgi:hypothetical protein